MRFFDTNVLVYCVDDFEPRKQAVAVQLVREAIADSTLVISTQVMQEFYHSVLRRKLLSPVDALDMLRTWSEHRVVGSNAHFVLHAIELQQKLRISIWDALLVQAALDAGCSHLVTEDLQHGLKVGDLEVVNPFVQPSAVHEPAPVYSKAAPPRRRRIAR